MTLTFDLIGILCNIVFNFDRTTKVFRKSRIIFELELISSFVSNVKLK